MRILFDQGTPVPLRTLLTRHNVSTVYELGWSQLKNGELLQQAEESGYEALVTTDQNLRYQQNLPGRKLAIAILKTTSWPRIQVHGSHVVARIDGLQTGGYAEIEVP
jgi:Domain of unknown function (DUF5615)